MISMLKQYFVKQGIKEAQIEDFIRSNFPMGDYSRTELQRTPLGIKVIIHTNKPGRIIGRGGKTINEMTDALKERFKLENPQLDVKGIENPDLDAKIVAKQIASAMERGYNYKKIGNLTIKRIMDAGAIGAEIVISGKLAGGKAAMGKFIEGYLKHSGHPAKELVDVGFEEAYTKPGKIGIKVKILREFLEITGERRKTRLPEVKEKKVEEREKVEKAKPKKKAPEKKKTKAKKAPAEKTKKNKKTKTKK